MRTILLAVLFLILIAVPAIAQEEKPVVVSDAVIGQVVRRIVTWYFRPRGRRTTIKIGNEFIKKEWLPNIKNIDFEVLESSAEGDHEDEPRMFFFREVRKDGRWFAIDFGYGQPHCDNVGDTWRFRVEGSRIRLYKQTFVGWGGGCAVGTGAS